MLGFLGLGIVWLYTTGSAYFAIRNSNIPLHQKMIIYSYAACFGGVTLRIWLPSLTIAFGAFLPAYKIVSWLASVPNIIFAHFWIKQRGIALG